MDPSKLEQFLDRTERYHRAIGSHVAGLCPFEGPRYAIALQAATLSLEHAAASVLLSRNIMFSPAISLMRTQFECFVRGVWLLYAASDTWVEKLSAPLTAETAKRANEGLGLAAMFSELRTCHGCPTALFAQLESYKEATWKAMNSYTHGGIHPLSRGGTGFSAELVIGVGRNSNAIVALAGQLASVIAGNQSAVAHVGSIQRTYTDCLPSISPQSTEHQHDP